MTGDHWDAWMAHDLLRDAAEAVDAWLASAACDDVSVEDAPFDADEDWGIEDEPCDPDDEDDDADRDNDDELLNDVEFLLNPHRPEHESRFT